MKHLILAAAVAAFSIQAAEPAELPVQATPKLSFVNNRSLPGKVELTETEKDGKKQQSFRITFTPDGKAKIFRAEIVMRPPLNAEQYNTFSFNYKTNTAFSGNTAVMSILDSFWKTSYNTTIPDTAKVKELEAVNRSSVGRFNFSVNLPALETGKEVVIEISDMKFVNLK